MNQAAPPSPFDRMSVEQASPSRSAPGTGPAISLRSILFRLKHGLRSQWWVVPICMLLFAGPPLFQAWAKSPTFVSRSVMLFSSKLKLPLNDLISEDVTTFVGTQVDLLKSVLIQSRAYQKTMARNPAARLPYSPPADTLPFAIDVKTSLRSSFLHLQARGPDPDSTQAFLNAVMEEYGNFSKERHEQASTRLLSAMTAQIKEVESRIQCQQHQLLDFQKSHNISSLTEHGQRAGSYLGQLAESLARLRTQQQLIEWLLANPSRPAGEASALTASAFDPNDKSALGSGIMPFSKINNEYYECLEKLHLLKSKQAEWGQFLRPNHSKMARLTQEITGLETLLSLLKRDEEQRVSGELVIRKHSLELQIRNLENQYAAWETNSAEASRTLAAYEDIRQESQRSQALYDRLVTMAQSVNLNKSLDTDFFTPLLPASPAQPTYAACGKAGLALFLSLITGLGTVLLMEWSRHHFLTAEELRSGLSVEVIGQIPNASTSSGQKKSHQANNNDGMFLEAFRHLRSSLFYMIHPVDRPRTLLVCSAVPQEGKSTVVANLAKAFALSEQRILVIDANCWRSSLHHLFGTRKIPGLSEVLHQSSIVSEAIIETRIPGVHLLPAGESRDADSEMLLSGSMSSLLKELAGRFDYLLIDSAPILSADYAASLGLQTDGILLVVRAACTPAPAAKEALNRLQQRNARVLGLVLNRIQPGADDYSRFGERNHNVFSIPGRQFQRSQGTVEPQGRS